MTRQNPGDISQLTQGFFAVNPLQKRTFFLLNPFLKEGGQISSIWEKNLFCFIIAKTGQLLHCQEYMYNVHIYICIYIFQHSLLFRECSRPREKFSSIARNLLDRAEKKSLDMDRYRVFRKNLFFHNSLQPLPRLNRCKRPSKLSTQCECTVTPIGW